MVKQDIRSRVNLEAQIFLEKKATVREVAKIVGCSKSTVHKDFRERLPKINNKLFLDVQNLLDFNKLVRHIRGGEATKKKYKKKNNEKSET